MSAGGPGTRKRFCRRHSAAGTHGGFTLIDIMISVAVVGVLIFAIMPSLAPDQPLRVLAAATMLTSDIEFAQSATLADPSDPTIVRFDQKNDLYWLALASAPDTPILRPNSDDSYLVKYGMGLAESLEGVEIVVADLDTNTIIFDAFGRLVQGGDPTICLVNDTGCLGVTVAASTGSVAIMPLEAPPVPPAEDDPPPDDDGGDLGGGLLGGGKLGGR